MPHLVLTYSGNIAPIPNLNPLFRDLHTSLAGLLDLKLDFFKSRAIRCDDFLIGDHDGDHAFMHLDIGIFPGRSLAVRQSVTEAAVKILEERVGRLPGLLPVHMTVNLYDLDPETYRKRIGGIAS